MPCTVDKIQYFQTYASLFGLDISTVTEDDIDNLMDIASKTILSPYTYCNINSFSAEDKKQWDIATILGAIYIFSKKNPTGLNGVSLGSLDSLSRTLPTGESFAIKTKASDSKSGIPVVTGFNLLDNMLAYFSSLCRNGVYDSYELPVFIEDDYGTIVNDAFVNQKFY